MKVKLALLLAVGVSLALMGGLMPLARGSAPAASERSAAVALPPDVLTATFVRGSITSHVLVGEFNVFSVPGTNVQCHRPVGPGIHALEIEWNGGPSQPQSIAVPLVGQVFTTDAAILVDFQSIDQTEFVTSSGVPQPFCDGSYIKVKSVVTAGNCWTRRTVDHDGLETQKCNASSGSGCTATITFDTTGGGDPVNLEFECGGGGSVDFQPLTGHAHANKASSGC